MEVSSSTEQGDTLSLVEGRKGSIAHIKERVGSFKGDELNKSKDSDVQATGAEKVHHDLGIMHVSLFIFASVPSACC